MAVKQIDYELCSSCGICERTCPVKVYAKCDETVFIRHRADCMSCFLCVLDCPKAAVSVDGTRGRPIPFPY